MSSANGQEFVNNNQQSSHSFQSSTTMEKSNNTQLTVETKTSPDAGEDPYIDDYVPFKKGPPPEIPEELFKLNPKVVLRDRWGAREPKYITVLQAPINKIVLTWTETDPCFYEEDCQKLIKEMQKDHIAEGIEPDIKHNFLLARDGTMYEGRGFHRVGPRYPKHLEKTKDLYGHSIQIAFIERCVNKPTPLLLKALADCLAFAFNGGIIERNFAIYWMSDKDVIQIQPTMIDNFTGSNT